MRVRAEAVRRNKKLIDRVAGVLWTGTGSPPWEWIMFEMCRTYGCTRSQLLREDVEAVMQDYQMLQVERKVLRGLR